MNPNDIFPIRNGFKSNACSTSFLDFNSTSPTQTAVESTRYQVINATNLPPLNSNQPINFQIDGSQVEMIDFDRTTLELATSVFHKDGSKISTDPKVMQF